MTLNTPLVAAPFGLIANHSYAILGKQRRLSSTSRCFIPCLGRLLSGMSLLQGRRSVSVLNSRYGETNPDSSEYSSPCYFRRKSDHV